MTKKRTTWTESLIMQEASKYEKYGDFIKGNRSAYQASLRLGLTDKLADVMVFGVQLKWTKEKILSEAKKYKTRWEFQKNSDIAYSSARYHGILDEVCAHMESDVFIWDCEMIFAEARKYKTLSDFAINSHGAYKASGRLGVRDIACAHMSRGDYGFSKIKPAVLYCIRFIAAGGLVLFKVGITNRSAQSRLSGMYLYPGVSAEIIDEVRFDRGSDARNIEKSLHEKFSEFRYRGPKIMKNGNTELFIIDVLSSGVFGESFS